ncbi:MAG: DNA polymerase III subunit beta [Candidatus Omnitrophota bacterium]
MKFSVEQPVLLNALQKVLGPATTKQNFPILSSVFMETQKNKLKLITTDLDTTIITFLETEQNENGKAVVSLKQLLSIIRELPAMKINIEIIKNNLLIKCENIEFKINMFNPSDFPKVDPIKDVALIKVNHQNIIDLLKLTSFCVGYEDTNYVLNGILFEIHKDQITAVATDGKRLAVARCPLSPNQPELKTKSECIIPVKAAHEIQKLIKEREEDVLFFIEKNRIGFDLKDTQIITRPIEGEFPNYTQYIPKPHTEKMTINRSNLLAALKRAALLSTPDYQGIKGELKKDDMVISKNTPQIGEVKENISCSYAGKNMVIGFNPNYLIDVLKNIEDENVVFEFFDVDKPAVLRKENYVYLVLPMKI